VMITMGETGSLLKVSESLEEGCLVGILGDRIFAEGERYITCDFLGKPARYPISPMLLAYLCKVPVILFYGLYSGGNRYDIHFELLVENAQQTSGTRDEVIAHYTRKYVARLEHYTRKSPYNWFNFYDYWEANNEK